ncbi:MAG: hypothetical protein AAFZ04_08570 [Pseudomonadota bacterium]
MSIFGKMKRGTVRLIVGSVLLLAFAGCQGRSNIEDEIRGFLPQGSTFSTGEICDPLFGPIVAAFSLEKVPARSQFLNYEGNGAWTVASSLRKFVEMDDYDQPLGMGATILDGKECLRDISDQADQILFGENPGLYYRSDKRRIVAVVFDDPLGTGFVFFQAP